MAYRAGVVGASGYTGAELLRLLAGHPEIDVVHVTAESNAGTTVDALYPSLGAAYQGLEYAPFGASDLTGLEVVFCALPHGESQRLVPGCYPTAASLALAPLVAGGFVAPTGIVVNACSGVSGRGRGLSAPSLYAEADENVTAYGLLTHRHTAEIELALTRVAGTDVQVLFTPHLVPMTRGILATCTARPAVDHLSSALLLAHYRDFYAGEPFVRVLDEPPTTKATTASNALHVTVRFDDRTGTVLAIAAEDNLVKGAAGQALQGANLLLGLPEADGLSAIGVAP